MLTLNGVNDDAKKKMHIMGLIGMHAYTELCHAMEGKDIATLTSENLFEMLRDRYAPKKLVVAQRDKFLGVKQKPNQSLAELVAELQYVATACDFEKITSAKEAREAFMLQGFLRALKSESTRVRLLQQEKLDFKKAFELASVLEEADKEGPSMGQHTGNHLVGLVQDLPKCNRCGTRHEYRKCPAYGEKCYKCGGMNHLAKCCRNCNDDREESPPRRRHRDDSPPRGNHQGSSRKHKQREDANRISYDTDDFDNIVNVVKFEKQNSSQESLRNLEGEASGERLKKMEKRSKKCYVCGMYGHVKSECRYKNGKCTTCNKRGHTAKTCFTVQYCESDIDQSLGRYKSGRDDNEQCESLVNKVIIKPSCESQSSEMQCYSSNGHQSSAPVRTSRISDSVEMYRELKGRKSPLKREEIVYSAMESTDKKILEVIDTFNQSQKTLSESVTSLHQRLAELENYVKP